MPNRKWEPFELEFSADGRTVLQTFSNVYAIGLGQLLRNSPGSSPLSMKLAVMKQGEPPITITVPAGGNQLTIEYALYGGPSDN